MRRERHTLLLLVAPRVFMLVTSVHRPPPTRADPTPTLPGRELVTCPTPGCGCYPLRADRVERHLMRCPKLVEQKALDDLGLWSAGANLGERVEGNPAGSESSLDAVEFAQRIADAHAKSVPLLAHTEQGTLTDTSELGVNKAERRRHQIQRDAIASVMDSMGLLAQDHGIVELGAGNAQLSLAIARWADHSTTAVRPDRFILVDRQKPRRNAEGEMERLGVKFERVRIGIEDLHLGGLARRIVRDRSPLRGYVVVAKHLCGEAADFALRAIAAAAAEPHLRPSAVLLGSCCHHRCTWGAYPNRAFLADLGFRTAGDFDRLCRLSSRGVDASDTSARAHTGRLAKDILDQGRAEFLRNACGYETAELRTIVDAYVSPENVLVVGS